ncbi:alpha/beta hydrolase [Lusitaniella coriacea]|uniref:alpha/beta hydrolase n=1 Tax=Lusitaniella coriacea TaxID=1983105 RepID=UPI003CEE6E9C
MRTPDFSRWFLLSWLLLVIGFGLCIAFNPGKQIASESIAIPLETDRAIFGKLYTPRGVLTPYPVMVLGHGVNNSKATTAPLAMELARHGIAALTFDFGGFGESYPLSTAEKSIESLETSTLEDARSVLAWIRDRPERLDPTRIGIGGHSMGGTTALQLAQIDPQLRATVVLSMSGTATSTAPRNLFFGVGVYDQMNSPRDIRIAMQAATASPDITCLDWDICGDFAAGTARQLAISATADHVFAPYDGRLTAAVIRWVRQSFAIETQDVSLVLPGWILGWELAFAGGLGVGIWGIGQLDRRVAGSRWRRLWRYGNPAFGAMVTIALWGYFDTKSSEIAANLLLFSYVLLLASNYALRDRKIFLKALRLLGLYALLFEFAMLLPTWICGLGELWQQPIYLVGLPQLIGQWLLWSGYWVAPFIKAAFFPVHTLELQLSGLFVLLVLWEFLRPGATFGAIEWVAVLGVRWLRRPFQVSVGRVSSQQIAGLSILLGLLAIVLHQRATDGLLELFASQGGLVVRQLSLLLVLPLVTIVGCARSRWFRRWEMAAIDDKTFDLT